MFSYWRSQKVGLACLSVIQDACERVKFEIEIFITGKNQDTVEDLRLTLSFTAIKRWWEKVFKELFPLSLPVTSATSELSDTQILISTPRSTALAVEFVKIIVLLAPLRD